MELYFPTFGALQCCRTDSSAFPGKKRGVVGTPFQRTTMHGAVVAIISATGTRRCGFPSIAIMVVVGLKKPNVGRPLETSILGRASARAKNWATTWALSGC